MYLTLFFNKPLLKLNKKYNFLNLDKNNIPTDFKKRTLKDDQFASLKTFLELKID